MPLENVNETSAIKLRNKHMQASIMRRCFGQGVGDIGTTGTTTVYCALIAAVSEGAMVPFGVGTT